MAAAAFLALLGAASALAQTAPALTSLSPAAVPAGADATITLNGTNLVSGTYVLVSGNIVSNSFCFSGPCPITYVNANQITVVLSATTLAGAGTLSVQVESPSGTVSNALALTVTSGGSPASNPLPAIVSLSPASATAGSPAFALSVTGTNFVSGSQVLWNGNPRTTTFVSATQLSASVGAADIANAGTAAVAVVNPAPGGGTSGNATFTINAGVPTGPPASHSPVITWVQPVATAAGGSSASLTVYGANFVSGASVQWNGANRPSTYVNANQLQVTLSAADIAAAGSGTLTVLDPAPGGGQSAGWIYPIVSAGVTVFPAGPQPVGLAPVAAAVDPALGRIYVVHRGVFRDICLDAVDCATWPSDVVTVVDQASGRVLATIGVGAAVNGLGQGIAVDSTRHRVFVTNADDSTVTVIDGLTNTTLATTPVDKGPEGIAVDPGRGIVYVAAANVTLLDAASGAALGSVSVGAAAWAVAVDPASHLAYALVNSVPKAVVAVDGAARSARPSIPLPPLVLAYSGIAVDPGSRVYACDYSSGTVTAIDIAGGTPAIRSFSATPYAEAIAVDPASHQVYVVGSGAGRLGIFGSDGSPKASLAVLRLPTAVALDPASGHAYVVNSQSDALSVVDMARLSVSGAIPLGVQPQGLALDPAGNRLYAANYIADAVSVIDPAARQPVGSWISVGATWSVAVDPALRQVYAVNSSDGSVNVFGTVDGSLQARLGANATGASAIAVNTATHMVYVSSGTPTGVLTVINGTSNQVVATIPVGSRPVGIAIDQAANRVFVANQQSATISVIDGAANQVLATWQPQLGNVWSLALDAALGRLYASIPPTTIGSFSGLEVLDSSTGAFVAQVAAGAGADGVAVNPQSHHVYLTDSSAGTVTVIDGTTNTVLQSLVTGTSAADVAVDAAAGLVYVSDPFDAGIAVFADQAAAVPVPMVNAGGIVSGASSGAGLSGGAIADLYGSNLAGATVVAPSGAPWPAALGNVQVLVNGFDAPLYFVSPAQIAFELPWEVLGQKQVSIVIVIGSLRSAPQTVPLAAAGPDIFTVNQQGTGQGAIQIANTVFLAAPAGSVPGASARPAARGEYLTIYCTGLGDVTNRPASGAPALVNPLSTTLLLPAVSIGGVPAPVVFSGLAPGFVGLYQVNVQVPSAAPSGNAVPVTVTVGSTPSNTVTIAVQ